ncbi:D-arabinono-1,4-lactone oxidase [Schizosaccharomyces pombe]
MSIPHINKLSQDGRVRFSNWAKTFSAISMGLRCPKTEEQLREILVDANSNGKKIRVVGAGHSPSDIVCTSGYLLSLDKMNKVVSFDPDSLSITVQAGIRFYQVQEILQNLGYSLPIVGSISETSVSGIMSTCTHGSSLQHQVLPHYIKSMRIMLADGSIVTCSRELQKDMFAAAQVSLGALGVIVDITISVVPAFDLVATEDVTTVTDLFQDWKNNLIWESAEFVRVHVFPYANRAVVWRANKVEPNTVPHTPKPSLFRLKLDSFVYQCLLFVGKCVNRFTPYLERFWFKCHYGSKLGTALQVAGPGFDVLQMFCYFSQHVSEWGIPLESAPDALEKLINYTVDDAGKIGAYTHWPIEVRVCAPTPEDECWLSTDCKVPTCYIEAIMYRPFSTSINYKPYFKALEDIANQYNGKPHWAKEYSLTKEQLLERYPNLSKWLSLRKLLDPKGVFSNDYLQRHLG